MRLVLRADAAGIWQHLCASSTKTWLCGSIRNPGPMMRPNRHKCGWGRICAPVSICLAFRNQLCPTSQLQERGSSGFSKRPMILVHHSHGEELLTTHANL